MSIQKELKDLIDNDIISEDIADKIRKYYQNDTPRQKQRLLIIFSIIGAVLISLGILLLIAHNWDNLSRITKTILAFLPIIIGQIACIYSFFKKDNHPIWTEGSGIFLSISLGATMSLISQIYNIPGSMGTFVFYWSILSIPIIYLMQSQITAVFSLLLVVVFAVNSGYSNNTDLPSILTWPLFISIMPFYIHRIHRNNKGIFVHIFTWLFCLSLTIIMGIHGKSQEDLLFITYFLMFQIFYLFGQNSPREQNYTYQKTFSIAGMIGMNAVLLTLSFNRFWINIHEQNTVFSQLLASPEFIQLCIILILSIWIKAKIQKDRQNSKTDFYRYLDIPFIIIFILGYFLPISVYLINILILGIGIFTIKEGLNKNSLSILNLGLFITSLLIIFRFFDADLSFVLKGILFILLGLSFFLANYLLIKKQSDDVA
jgi:uncharacterized membrane protein